MAGLDDLGGMVAVLEHAEQRVQEGSTTWSLDLVLLLSRSHHLEWSR